MSNLATLPAEPFGDPQQNQGTPAWKQEVNQRLAAHRNRRGGSQDETAGKEAENARAANSRSSEVAARVAARYAKAPSYSELLAGEARAVVRAAGAAAEAARSAQAAAQAVLAGLESGKIAPGQWESKPQVSEPEAPRVTEHVAPSRWQDEPPVLEQPDPVQEQVIPQQNAWAGAQPRWEEALPKHSVDQDAWSEMRVPPSHEPHREYRTEPLRAYQPEPRGYHPAPKDELFSPDPLANAMVEPVQHIPANLIEFPRELVATRKARPRLAEGPNYGAHGNSQLNIFEVDPDSLDVPASSAAIAGASVAPPEWASIELEHGPEPAYAHVAREEHVYAHAVEVPAVPVESPRADDRESSPAQSEQRHQSELPGPQARQAAIELLVAPLSDRMLASVVDCALITLAFLVSSVVVIASTAHPPTGKIALIAAGCGILVFGLVYQLLFLSFAEEGTPGMRYARIALCTFEDENPTIEQMRMRIPAMLFAALPAGLGLLWAIFDRDHLGWHDRLSRTYQRKY